MKFHWKIRGLTCFLTFCILLSGCARQKTVKNRSLLVEKVGELAFIQCQSLLYDSLSLKEKILAYHLSRAVLAGDPIVYKQIHRQGYRIKLILDGIMGYSEGLNQRTLSEISFYTKLYWANSGFYHLTTGQKFLPLFDRRSLQGAVVIALSNGAEIGFRIHRNIPKQFDELQPFLFDSTFEDILDIQHGLFRAGNDTLEPGLGAEELSAVVDNLRLAQGYCDQSQQVSLENLALFFETADDGYYIDYLADISQSKRKVECVSGFHPFTSCSDTNNLYFGLVFIRDKGECENIERLYRAVIATGLGDIIPLRKDNECRLSAGEALTAAGDLAYRLPPILELKNPADESHVHSVYLNNVHLAGGIAHQLSELDFSAEKFLMQLRAIVSAELEVPQPEILNELATIWILETASDSLSKLFSPEVIAQSKAQWCETQKIFSRDTVSIEEITTAIRQTSNYKNNPPRVAQRTDFAVMTPILELKSTKMGKIKDVEIRCTYDVLKYGLYITNSSRLESESDPKITNR